MDSYNHNMPPTPSSRAEADRWLAIAEKLLANRDLVGSKTFAIRARESDPRLESADQILALADTLIASDKHIIINNNNNNNNNSLPDWYSVLQLPPLTSDSDLIAAHYRGLAILLNPNRSRLPFAHQAFQIVSDAWSVLSNPQQKSVYDRQIAAVHHNNNINININNNNNNNNNNSGSGFDANAGGHDNTNNNNGSNSRVYETNPREDVNASGWAAGPGGNDGDNGNNNVRNADGDDRGNVIGETFWTACPYCYNMYEYPKAYEECTMRCQNCRRAFHGAKIPSPPLQEREREGEGEGETTYATWGFYPLGVSMSMMEMNKGGVANWTPFSPMFSCPSVKVEVAEEKKKKSRMTEPVVYIEDEDGDDDDDVFFDDFESSEGSDDEWGSTKKKTKKRRSGRRGRGKRTAGRRGKEGPVDDVAQEGGGVANKMVSGKKQVGKAMKERGKLDLNVEFNNNEVEENANGVVRGSARTENGEEDGEIEGIGFFEGLDEFLSSLPILNVVGDDKVKAA